MLFGCVENGVGERTCCGVDVGVEECVPVDVVEGLVKLLPLCISKVPNGALKWNLFDGLEGECGENSAVKGQLETRCSQVETLGVLRFLLDYI